MKEEMERVSRGAGDGPDTSRKMRRIVCHLFRSWLTASRDNNLSEYRGD